MKERIPCSCPCHIKPERDIHVSPLTDAVIWCCSKPYQQPPPLVEPTPMFSIEVVEVKPMGMPRTLLFELDWRYGNK